MDGMLWCTPHKDLAIIASSLSRELTLIVYFTTLASRCCARHPHRHTSAHAHRIGTHPQHPHQTADTADGTHAVLRSEVSGSAFGRKLLTELAFPSGKTGKTAFFLNIIQCHFSNNLSTRRAASILPWGKQLHPRAKAIHRISFFGSRQTPEKRDNMYKRHANTNIRKEIIQA